MVKEIAIKEQPFHGEREEERSVMPDISIEKMLNAYLEAALWSTTDWDSGEPLDENHSVFDVSEEVREQSRKDCIEFAEMAGDLLNYVDSDQAGHDFWLTRNGHGAGFWDRDYPEDAPEDIGGKLTEIAKSFREVDLFANEEDGKIYM